MAKRVKKLHKLKSRRSTQKTIKRITENSIIINKLKEK